ncbi:YttA [Neobacillus massiliamazoniensis]|uniref:YttA n=1 Tax=Neobacillus massiliamazoniensis TaxID=1499688 RepID=A0A0U1NZG5_9BACI|nr:YttA [Neobacillus massiliamazoniensis]
MKKCLFVLSLLILTACSNNTIADSENISGTCDDPKIKGNLTTYNGEKIYHVPGGQFYDKTIAEEMFCTEEDAEAAGYRKSMR